MKAAIKITDPDRQIEFVLAVDYTRLPAESETGLSANVEIESVRLAEAVLWLGKYGVSAFPGCDARESLEKRMGQHCLDKYRDEIEAALLGLTTQEVM